jgi:hypothetical protein
VAHRRRVERAGRLPPRPAFDPSLGESMKVKITNRARPGDDPAGCASLFNGRICAHKTARRDTQASKRVFPARTFPTRSEHVFTPLTRRRSERTVAR